MVAHNLAYQLALIAGDAVARSWGPSSVGLVHGELEEVLAAHVVPGRVGTRQQVPNIETFISIGVTDLILQIRFSIQAIEH